MNKLDSKAVAQFASGLRGRTFLPSAPEYDQARKIWNGMIDRRPAVIVQCSGVADVINAVNFARESRLVVAVRGGGHNVAGNAVCDAGMMIDLSKMKSIRVDPVRRVARAEPGVIWREFDREAQTFALGTTGGLVSTTGIAGFTLGGGIGWLVRKHGLACDNLLSVDVVTADGKMLTASPSENSDLFWGIRGGGGNFGIVTSFEYKLHPVGPIVLGGLLAHRAEDGRALLRFCRDFIKDAPTELTTLIVYLTAPPAPFLPTEVHGKQLVAIALCYAGKIEDGEKLLKPLRKFGKPVVDHIQPMPYSVLQSMFDEAAPPGVQNYWKSSYINGLTDSAIDTILERGAKITSPMSAIHVHQLGGTMRTIPEDATAFSHRDAPFIVNLVTTWQDPSENQKHMAWTRDSFAALEKFAVGAYVNFLGEEGDERVKAAYGERKLRKLTSLKNKYDPTNFFHMNQNIKPNT